MFENLFPRKVDALPEEWREPLTPILEQFRREKRAADIKVQESIPEQIAEIQAKIDALQPTLEARKEKLAKSEHRVLDAQAERQAALNAYEETRWTIGALRGEIEALKSRQAAHGSRLLDEAYREFHKKWDELRLAVRTEERGGEKNILGEIKNKRFSTNFPAVEKGIAYLRGVMSEIQVMKSQPLTDEEIEARLAEMRKGIPSETWEIVNIDLPKIIEPERPRYGATEPPRLF
jgi:hypothetical protein